MRKSGWLVACATLLIIIAVSYSFLFHAEKPPESPSEQPLLFSQDNASLDWLEDPEIPAEMDPTEEPIIEESPPEVPKESPPIAVSPEPKPQEKRLASSAIVDSYKQ